MCVWHYQFAWSGSWKQPLACVFGYLCAVLLVTWQPPTSRTNVVRGADVVVGKRRGRPRLPQRFPLIEQRTFGFNFPSAAHKSRLCRNISASSCSRSAVEMITHDFWLGSQNGMRMKKRRCCPRRRVARVSLTELGALCFVAAKPQPNSPSCWLLLGRDLSQ